MNRRDFLRNSTATGIALNLQLAGHVAAANNGVGDDRKTLVCVYFGGGWDTYHTLIPTDPTRYGHYRASRDLIARLPDDLSDLVEAGGPSVPGETYGIPKKYPELIDMFNGTGDFVDKPRASWVSNVGTLIKPLTMEEYRAGVPGFDIPVGVGGHVRQSEQWQTTLPQGTVNLRGWLGRAADMMRDGYNRDNSSMNLSLAGNNIMQLGNEARPVSYSPFGQLGLSEPVGNLKNDPNNPLNLKNLIHRRILDQSQTDFVDKSFADISRLSLGTQDQLQAALDAFDDDSLLVPFGRSAFERNMEAVLKLIATRSTQGLCRQTFFVPAVGGWDDHFLLGEGYESRMEIMSKGIATFQRNIEHLGLDEGVLGFTASEFARTLRSTEQGSDHAWGGPQMLFGTPIEGGKIFGDFPSLELDGPDDTGRGGRILPTRSCDEFFADMLKWFGIKDEDLNLILPNYDNFRVDGRDPIGYLANV